MSEIGWLGAMWVVARGILLESAPWIVLSLIAGGLIREFLSTARLRARLNGSGPMAMLSAVAVGALLPICSCGVIPLAVSLYRAGVRLGPVMAFAAATPIINPAAVILSYALLGPELAAAYIALGLTLPLLLGVVSERFGEQKASRLRLPAVSAAGTDVPGTPAATFGRRVQRALRWGLFELGSSLGFYLAIGILFAAVLGALVPPEWLRQYVGSGSWIGLAAAGVLGASIYVCAVAHIPIVAGLLAAGAGPGAAIVFLVTGTATNLPELIALYHSIGRRVVILYATMLIVASVAAGAAVNAWLGADYRPVLDPAASLALFEQAEGMNWRVPGVLAMSAGLFVTLLAVWGGWRRLRTFLARGGRMVRARPLQ